jgi:5-methylcytosine-specific restriction protein B
MAVTSPALYVFTAGNPDARQHLADTVLHPIDRSLVIKHLGKDKTAELELRSTNGGLYAWGALPTENLIRVWTGLSVGDQVLVYYEGTYHLVSRVTEKLHNPELAKDLWTTGPNGTTWEYMYFLDEPKAVNVRSAALAYLKMPEKPQGFMRISSALEPIRDTYGSVDGFVAHLVTPDQSTPEPAGVRTPSALRQVAESFADATKSVGLDYGEQHRRLVVRLLASLLTRPFVILTGLSGSGKSQLALKLGQWFGAERYSVVAVRPDWTGPEAMLGYEDLLQPPPRPWVVGEVLKLSLRAAFDPGHPYLLLLDEMNLAHVERYFADFLSGMESDEPVIPSLTEQDGSWRIADPSETKLRVPRNLFVVGTVNVDETTYMFSPKVLDRANTIEFRVRSEDLSNAAGKPGDVEEAAFGLLETLVTAALDTNWHAEHRPNGVRDYEAAVTKLHQTLTEVGWEFGYRTYHDMLRFAAFASAMGIGSWQQILDIQILQKVLPRLNGSRRRLEPALSRLGRFCHDLAVDDKVKDEPNKIFMPNEQALPSPLLPQSYDKVRRMHRLLVANQFASFAE